MIMIIQPCNSLKDYHTTPNKKKFNINNMPPDEYRLHNDEIKSANEYTPSSKS